MTDFVSLHPYFKAHEGQAEAVMAMLPKFVELSADEEKSLFYGFTVNGDEIFCREGYADAEAVLTHPGNVGEQLGRLLEISDLTRLEVHGPASEIDQLREPLAPHNPTFWVSECAVEKG